MRVRVIGGGLAGCEAAWFLAEHGVQVDLFEQKPAHRSAAHKEDFLAELVCSNSLKAERIGSAAGLLKAEMELLGSLLVPCAKATAVSAGGALAVDRTAFGSLVTEKISSHPNICVLHQRVDTLPADHIPTIVATGPLTSHQLAADIQALCGTSLAFYDAAAPIVTFDSLDKDKVFFAARYDRGEADYINCPMDREQYAQFYAALVSGERAELHDVDTAEKNVYEGCMPIEIMARRGEDTIRFGPLKPVGLRDPKTGKRPWAAVQLRAENQAGTLYNLVGFQTNLKFGEQKRIFSMIPGLENAEFVRYGVMHRNTFLCSPALLDKDFRLKQRPSIRFAGQIVGVEGYMESAMTGLVAALSLWLELQGRTMSELPVTTMSGALCRHVYAGIADAFQPMGANIGILPPLEQRIRDKQERYSTIAQKGLADFAAYIQPIFGEQK